MKDYGKRIVSIRFSCSFHSENIIEIPVVGNAFEYKEKFCVFCGMPMQREYIWNQL